MALLQISEPGESTEPHRHRLAAGIDLGTTHSLVASVRSGSVAVLPDLAGRVLLPSVVRFLADGTVLVGADALAHTVDDPSNTIVSVKRLMGRGGEEVGEMANAYDVVAESGMIRLRTVQGEKSPVQVSAEILRVLRERAEKSLGDGLTGVVITVPAYFDDAQRQATRDAAALAGLHVYRLLNEPTAAAIAYGLDNDSEGTFAIYDLGGGTFDISILRLSKGVFEVIATGGDSALGGDDFDELIVNWAICGAVEATTLDAADWRRLRDVARRTKESLSSVDEVTFEVTLSNSRAIERRLTRLAFEELSRPLLRRTIAACRQALDDASLKPVDIKGVVLVGGATRMPQVREVVRTLFGSEPLDNIDPDQVVAIGAARQANLLAGNKAGQEDWLLLDVIPLSLGLETMGGLVERVIPRNATIPVARAQQFTTHKDGQTAMAIHVVQGERELVSDCRSLARFELRGIPPMTAGAARIEVIFQVDADGLLSVSAREVTSGVKAQVTVKPSYGLTDGEIATMLQGAFASAGHDMEARALREQQVEAERMLEAIRSAIGHDGDLLSVEERAALDALCARLETTRSQSDIKAIRQALAAVSQGSEAFAAKRMDRAMARALSGRSINEV